MRPGRIWGTGPRAATKPPNPVRRLTSALRDGHRLVEGGTVVPGATAVGSFAGRHGKRLTLWRLSAEGTTATEGSAGTDRPIGAGSAGDVASLEDVGSAGDVASLEDVVLGYLAAGRGNAGLRLD